MAPFKTSTSFAVCWLAAVLKSGKEKNVFNYPVSHAALLCKHLILLIPFGGTVNSLNSL